MVLSLQGCMAVGKTMVVTYLKEYIPYVNISYERDSDIIQKVKEKNNYKDYLEIQKLRINNEIERYHKAIKIPCSIMGFGAEGIEFYTINYLNHRVRLGNRECTERWYKLPGML